MIIYLTTFFRHLLQSAFDQEEAKREGFITPQSGIDEEYDTVMTEFEEIKKESNDYLKKLEKHFGVPVKYVGTGYKRYQIEIPDKVAKKVGDDYEQMGTRKDFKRYYTSESKVLFLQVFLVKASKLRSIQYF